MKSSPVCKAILVAVLFVPLVLSPAPVAAADKLTDTIEQVRTTYQTDRQVALIDALPLSEEESNAFWPLYRAYRADMEKLGDQLVKVILEYGDVYPNVPDERARQLLKEYLALEEKIASKRAWYFKRANKFLPAAKVLRWAQVENRMDLGLRLQLASVIPLVPAR